MCDARTAGVLSLCLLAPVPAASYAQTDLTIEGITLGKRIQPDWLDAHSYICRPSEDFLQSKWCRKVEDSEQNGHRVHISRSILVASDGRRLRL